MNAVAKALLVKKNHVSKIYGKNMWTDTCNVASEKCQLL